MNGICKGILHLTLFTFPQHASTYLWIHLVVTNYFITPYTGRTTSRSYTVYRNINLKIVPISDYCHHNTYVCRSYKRVWNNCCQPLLLWSMSMIIKVKYVPPIVPLLTIFTSYCVIMGRGHFFVLSCGIGTGHNRRITPTFTGHM